MIIAILAAIAVPQYKHAVLKSRFSTVMPMAKAIADAQEVYYQGRQMYALDVDELDVTPVNAENTSVALSQTDGYDYVMAQNSQVPGANYIIYQKYSENYPSEIHCEAADDNEDAQWLCGVLSNNNSIGQTITSGYTTYVINGTGAGIAAGAGSDSTNENGQVVVSCDAADAMGLSCNITTNEAGEQVKQICVNGFCRIKTYNEDGSYTSVTCQANNSGVCTGNWKSATYDANGNQTSTRECYTIASDGTCSKHSPWRYDYTYDANGNMTSERFCDAVASDGTCSAYGNSEAKDYTYDANGNRTSQRRCSTVASDGTCSAYSTNPGDNLYYTYDANGNRTSQQSCQTVAADGSCSKYGDYNGSKMTYTYDANGNQLTQRNCHTVAADGSCSVYRPTNDSHYDYTYDANGNRTSQRKCSTVASDGTCSAYASWRYDYTYDANGNQMFARYCSTVAGDGTCSAYGGTTSVYTYDDNGKQIARQYCFGSNINTATGECTAYDGTIVQYD